MRISDWSSDVCSSDLLRIKAFFGTSANAVKTQVWIAVSVYVLIAIVRKRCGSRASLYEWLQILSVTLFVQTPLDEMFAAPARLNSDEGAAKQSERRRVGKECVSTGRSRLSPDHKKTRNKTKQ